MSQENKLGRRVVIEEPEVKIVLASPDDEREVEVFWSEMGAGFDPFKHTRTETDRRLTQYCIRPKSTDEALGVIFGSNLVDVNPGAVLISGREGSGKTALSVLLERSLLRSAEARRVRFISGDQNGLLNLARISTARKDCSEGEVIIVDLASDSTSDDVEKLVHIIYPELMSGDRTLAIFGSKSITCSISDFVGGECQSVGIPVAHGRIEWTPRELVDLVNRRIEAAFNDAPTDIRRILKLNPSFQLGEMIGRLEISTPREIISFLSRLVDMNIRSVGEEERIGEERRIGTEYLYRLLGGTQSK